MTVSSALNRKSYAGNGTTTSFATSPVAFFDDEDLVVIVATDSDGSEDELVLNTGYTVSGGAGEVGTVVTTVAPAVGETLVIVRRLAVTQESDFVNNSISDADVAEEAWDRLTMIAQQLATDSDRSMRFPEGFTGTFSPFIPAGVLDAPGGSFIVNDDGDGFTVGPTADEISSAQTYASAAATSATASATSAAAALVSENAAYTSAATAAAVLAGAIQSTIVDAKGDLIVATAADTVARMAVGNKGTLKMADSAESNGWRNWVPRNHISGLIVSNNSGDANKDLDIAVGEATDDTAAYMMILTSAMTKQADATWAAGTAAGGMLNGETIPAAGTLHVWLIYNPTTNATDVGFNNHATTGLSPTLPSGYTIKRLIGSRRTTSSNLLAFTAAETAGGGERVRWTTPTLDVDQAGALTTSRRTDEVKVPLGYKTDAVIRFRFSDVSATSINIITDPDEADAAPSATVAPLNTGVSSTSYGSYDTAVVRTSSAGLIAARSTLATVDNYMIVTLGWDWSRRI